MLAHFPICGPGRLLSWQGELLHDCQERFFLAVVEEDERIMLKVWDFGDNESPERRVDVNECTNSDAIPAVEVEIPANTEREKRKSMDTGVFTTDDINNRKEDGDHPRT